MNIDKFINNAYLKILERNVDESGLNSFRNAILSNLINKEDLETILIESEEYANKILIKKNTININNINSKKTSVCLEGSIGTKFGYCVATESIGMGLSKYTDLEFFTRYNYAMKNNELSYVSKFLTKNPTKNAHLIVSPLYEDSLDGGSILLPGPKRKSDSKKIIFTMFEADMFPRSWHERVKKFDAIIFPSIYNLDIFKNENNSIPSYVSKIGVRTDIFRKKTRTFPINKKFKFLTYLSGHHIDDDRKNFKLIFYAFSKLFKNNKNVELIIKTNIKSEKLNFIGGIPDNIKFIDEHFDTNKLSLLLWQCDCFVFPSKGEGYGLPPREAMATSIPTIIVDFSALSDISSDNISFPIRTKGRSTAIFDDNIAKMHNLGNNVFGKWANPSQDELIEKMLFIYNNYDKAIDIGKCGADFIHNNENIDLCGKNLNKILSEIK